VPKLLTKPRVKDTFAMGKVIELLFIRINRHLTQLSMSCSKHTAAWQSSVRFVKARRLLVLTGNVIVQDSVTARLVVDTESEYLSKGYLDHLHTGQSS